MALYNFVETLNYPQPEASASRNISLLTAPPSFHFTTNCTAKRISSNAAALINLKQDVVRLEKSILQQKQQLQEAKQQQLKEKIQHLQESAERINALAAQLAAEINKFQEKAQQINRDCRAIYSSSNVWENQNITIPIIMKRGFQFVLTTIKVEKPENKEEDAAKRAARAQQRREALERWLEARRQKIVDNFSGL